MAPRKSKKDGEEKEKRVTASLRVTRSMSRQTRSSTQRVGANSSGSASKLVKAASPAKKKTKRKTAKEVGKRIKKENEAADGEDKKETAVEGGAAADDAKGKTIVIEHCKQCNSFKTRAIQVKEGLEEAVHGITVVLNPEKPRRGCFEIREDSGETLLSLLDMKRPFAPMKALDMKQVIADIIEKIK